MLESKYKIQLDRLEKRQQHVAPPWWTPPFTCIAKSPELAIKKHDTTETETQCIYADGSSINSHVGAAAIAPIIQLQGIRTKRTEYMGTSTTSTAYTAELKGIEFACHILLDIHALTNIPRKCVIFTDNQAAIQAMTNPKPPSGQYILIKAIQSLNKLQNQGWEIQLRWIPAHVGVPDNEAANWAAKEASSHSPNVWTNLNLQPEPESLRALTATTESTICQAMTDEWELSWETAKHGREVFKLGVRPGKGTLTMHSTQICIT